MRGTVEAINVPGPRAHAVARHLLAAVFLLSASSASPQTAGLSAEEVQRVVVQTAAAAQRRNLRATIAVTDTTATLDGDMTINRQDFGVAYKGKPDDLIEDNVIIHLEIRAKKE